eukprot:3790468-Alexandrium_andersonii.AAC.1
MRIWKASAAARTVTPSKRCPHAAPQPRSRARLRCRPVGPGQAQRTQPLTHEMSQALPRCNQ